MGGAMGESDKTPRRSTKKARRAIYTRKSSEEGLEQAFNSLDAQREACAAFILSQKHEGWTVFSLRAILPRFTFINLRPQTKMTVQRFSTCIASTIFIVSTLTRVTRARRSMTFSL